MRDTGLTAAYGRRRPAALVARRAVNLGLRLVAERLDRTRIDYLHFWPPVGDASTLADLSARINWYLPDLDLPIYLPGVEGEIPDPSAAPQMDPALVPRSAWTADKPSGRPRYVLHDVQPGSLVRQLPRLRRSTVADPALYYTSELGYRRLRTALSPTAPTATGFGLVRLMERRTPGGKALVLGTGPSAVELDPSAVDADVRIVCNSAVRNHELLRSLDPSVLTFADPVFHFGPSRYAAAFRADVLRTVAETRLDVVVPETFASLLLAHFPSLADRLVALAPDSSSWNWPTATNPSVRDTGNVLTFMMLPLALTLADHVDIAGCDGRQPSENYFWKHSGATQYSDELMRNVFSAHPAFFRDRSYADYYDKHCGNLEDLLQTAESQGKTARAVTSSWMPALSKRGAAPPALS